MMNRLKTYRVNIRTMAFIPNFDEEYLVKVKERGRTEPIYVKQTALKLIDQACKEQLSDYRSRRKAVQERLKFPKKPPIAIDILRKIYAFPTESPKNATCHWLFLSHIKEIVPLHNKSQDGAKRTKIIFKDLQELVIDTSTHIILNQFERTLHCKEVFEELMISRLVDFKIIAEPTEPYREK